MRVLIYIFIFFGLIARPLLAQQSGQSMQGELHHGMQSMDGMDISPPASDWKPSPHAGSGTSWQPASVPGYFWMTSRGDWDLMAHGVLFLTYNQQGGPRGVGKAESVNVLMLMEQHMLG